MEFHLQLRAFEKNNMSDIKKDMLIEDLKELPDVEKDNLSLDIVYIYELDNGVEVRAFIRNSTEKEIAVGECEIALMNTNTQKIMAKEVFAIDKMIEGNLQAKSAAAVDFVFEGTDKISCDKSQWQLTWGEDVVFGETQDIEYKFLNDLNDGKELIEKYIETLKPVIKNTVKIDLFSLSKGSDGEIDMLIMVRNAKDKAVAVKKLPIKIICDGEVVAGGSFETSFIEVAAREGKLFKFPLRKEFIKRYDFDLNKSKIVFR